MTIKSKLYNILKLFCFGAIVAGGFLSMASPTSNAQVLVDPPCETTTCISQDMIDIAHHSLVGYDPAVIYLTFLLEEPLFPCSTPPVPTGVEVHRQIIGALEKFTDGFCTNQGCIPTIDGAECVSSP